MSTKNNPNRQRMLLTCIEITAGGPVKMNGGKSTGIRCHVKTAEGRNGQFWAAREDSLKNFPLNEPRWYEVEPLESYGAQTWKFYPIATANLTDDEKEQRRAYMASRNANAGSVQPPVEAALPAAPVRGSIPSPCPPISQQAMADLHNTIISAAAYLAAVILVAAGKEEMDEILPCAELLKKDIKTVEKLAL